MQPPAPDTPSPRRPLSARKLAACRANLARARAVSARLPRTARQRAANLRNLRKGARAPRKSPWQLTPARRAAALRSLRKAWAVNRRHYRLTARRRAASKANIRLAHEALRRNGPSPAQLAAMRANIAQGRAARTPESFRRIGLKALRHGLHAGSVRQTMRALGDDPRRLERLERWLGRLFTPSDEEERKVVSALAEALLRRQRLWRAEAYWQDWKIRQAISRVAPLEGPHPESTYARAISLLEIVIDQKQVRVWDQHLVSTIERLMRKLVRKRSQGKLDFKFFAYEVRRTRQRMRAQEREDAEWDFWERLLTAGPDVKAAMDQVLSARR